MFGIDNKEERQGKGAGVVMSEEERDDFQKVLCSFSYLLLTKVLPDEFCFYKVAGWVWETQPGEAIECCKSWYRWDTSFILWNFAADWRITLLLENMLTFYLFMVLFRMATVHKPGRHQFFWVYESHIYAEGKHNCLLVVVLSFKRSLGGCNSTNSLFKTVILNWTYFQLGTCLYRCPKPHFSGAF